MRPWLHKDHLPGSCSQKGEPSMPGTTAHVGHFFLCDPGRSLHPSQPASSLTTKLGLALVSFPGSTQCQGSAAPFALRC